MIKLIIAIALKNQVDPNLLLAICHQESKFHNVITHDRGSQSFGPCQTKHIAAKQVKLDHLNLKNVNNSIKVAALYLKYNINRCSNLRSAIAAYNVGHCLKNPKANGYTDKVLNYYYIINTMGGLE